MKETRVMHPLLFAIFPILFLFSHNIAELSILDQRSLLDLMESIAITLCFTLLLWFLLNVLFKNPQKSGIVVSMFLFMFFSYGQLYHLFEHFYFDVLLSQFAIRLDFNLGGVWFGQYKIFFSVWLILWVTLFAFVIYFLRQTSRNLGLFTQFLNIFAGVLIIISVANITAYETRRAGQLKRRSPPAETSSVKESKPVVREIAATLPDIYYIILDGYVAASTLKDLYHYDNQPFLDDLTTKGFFVASQSRSNYAFTHLSLASSLNMDYVNDLSDHVGRDSKDLRIPEQMVENNKVMGFLKSRGYTFIHVNSGWPPTRRNRYADWDIGCDQFLEEGFMKLLFQTTALGFLTQSNESYRERTLCQFSKLAQLDNIKGPIFVFAHIVVPHEPYVFGVNGEQISNKEQELGDEKTLYVNQLRFINTKVKELVAEILSKSEKPPIIIFQGDHGPWHIDHGSLKLSEDAKMKAKMRILNVYYFPPGDQFPVYDSITPVNTFRIIFNYYFGMSYALLKDQSYYSDLEKSPYKLTNVTELTKYD